MKYQTEKVETEKIITEKVGTEEGDNSWKYTRAGI